ncbi:MAG: anti-phage defense ZorAB system ZorA [Methylococcales bacterium]|jgi:hypothetical protein|nr:anti-phage defense ZorAB system ZorA [Methylococcales bacterium]
MSENINLSGLLPNLSAISDLNFPETAEQLSAYFVVVLVFLFSIFLLISFYAFLKSKFRIGWLKKLLNNQTSDNVIEYRETLFNKADSTTSHGGHLWKEFDESLIEVNENGHPILKNTLDAHHFFNSSTLAGGITESRMIAAVPGFLTACGVIGTFVGLQLGLSELNIGNDVAVTEMKTGLAHVISGAKIAFMTSVWGVFLSVVFNFLEKWMEQSVRKNIHQLQTIIDKLFPRLSAEEQLQRIADDGRESRESLQGLAERIGEKMQESLLEATKGIQIGLETSLEKIMAPAINKLVDETSDGNQKALENLVENFLSRFGELGSNQREAMDVASQNVSNALGRLNDSMDGFLSNLQQTQGDSAEREKQLIITMSEQVNQLVDHSNEQHKVLTDFVSQQLEGMSENFQSRDKAALERDQQRQDQFKEQSDAITNSTSALLQRIDDGLEAQFEASQKLIEQGNALQMGVENSVKASAQASASLQASSTELNTASQEMKVFGSHIRDAGNNLSGAVKTAVESTSDLARQNQAASELMEKQREQMVQNHEKFVEAIEKMQSLILSADTSFETMRSHQHTFLNELKGHVGELSDQMANLLTDYAKRANAQTENHLNVWANSTTSYAETMNAAAKTLATVVDDIEVKLGR